MYVKVATDLWFHDDPAPWERGWEMFEVSGIKHRVMEANVESMGDFKESLGMCEDVDYTVHVPQLMAIGEDSESERIRKHNVHERSSEPGEPDYVLVVFMSLRRKHTGKSEAVIFSTEAFVLNDEGKTIERIKP